MKIQLHIRFLDQIYNAVTALSVFFGLLVSGGTLVGNGLCNAGLCDGVYELNYFNQRN